jgi:DNA-binding response OmpR family regulator
MPKIRVLITDDETDLRTELALLLNKRGYLVREAENGKVAVDLIKKQEFDIMILDLKMPQMNGFDVLGHLKETGSKIRTIVLTGSILGSTLPDTKSLPQAEKKRILKFADIVMNKPFNVIKLLENIKALSERK